MNEKILISMVAELNKQLSEKTLGEIEFKARLTESQQEVTQLTQELEFYRSVLESDKDLKDLFEEIKNKNEVTK
jgi:hypothetical protein